VSISFIIVAVISIMFVTAYHRVVDEGTTTEELHRYASLSIIFSLMSLAIGLSIELYIITAIITRSPGIALVFSAASLLLMYFVWFGLTGLLRRRKRS
jgi:hypothetical protein